ncbi:hypothetical protein RclHR1_05250003 [Rhizophagus clarus]|uniref:Uncharacterized protein n=1 Tax=Rhizophagus clarus TaxID=94130 RepID=A0A2Z6SEB1_9GLOM|nr:hypothetical protein RclHR1_05250003 [Rhizophagus clarus]GES93986.1 hypothetical protein RCL_e20657_RclHR1_05250003 [Rhizophagus clarus]
MMRGLPDDIRDNLILSTNFTGIKFFAEFDFKSCKILKETKDKNTLVTYFETYEGLKETLESTFTYNKEHFRWTRSNPASAYRKKEDTGDRVVCSKGSSNGLPKKLLARMLVPLRN